MHLNVTLPLVPQKVVLKLWGTEFWLTNTDKYCAKVLEVMPNWSCSLHYHPVKQETFYVLEGEVKLEQRDVRGVPFEEILKAGDQRLIMPKTPHRFSSLEGAQILEISTHHEDEDTIRIEESRKI
jgi:mannose-6-phosphate isomerase-like protein (cupin superfamily)